MVTAADRVRRAFKQFFFLSAGELLNMPLAAHGFLFRMKSLQIDEHHRITAVSVLSPFAAVVGGESFLYVIGPAAIIRVVRAKDDVCVVHHSPLSKVSGMAKCT